MSEKSTFIGNFCSKDAIVIVRPGSRLIYTIKDGESWILTSLGELIISHPDRPPKWVKADGSEEEITAWPK